ncbi:MAG: radical SAM protein [bacterium]
MKESLPHIGVAYLAANVNPGRVEVRVYDCPALGMPLRALVSALREFEPDVAGFTAMTSQIAAADAAACAVKTALPDALTVVGGYHSSAVPGETLERYGGFDAAVYGEGEVTVDELLCAVGDGVTAGGLDSVKGVCRRSNGGTRLAPPREFVEDLDSLRFPAYELMPMDRYGGFYTLFALRRKPAVISLGRGCPYGCIFCFKVTGSRHRTRSIGSVMEEAGRDIREFGVRDLVIADESFLLNHGRVMEFCEAMMREGFHRKVGWVCQARVDHAEPDVLKLMRKAGCRVVAYGIESGNQEILRGIRKGITLAQAVDAVRWTKEAGILADTNFIIGHPGDTHETIRETIEFAVKLDAHMASFATLVPFPGTEVARMAAKGEGGLRVLSGDHVRFCKQAGGVMELEGIALAELEKYHRIAYLRFFMRPSKIGHLFRVVDFRSLLLMGLRAMTALFQPKGNRRAGSSTVRRALPAERG